METQREQWEGVETEDPWNGAPQHLQRREVGRSCGVLEPGEEGLPGSGSD